MRTLSSKESSANLKKQAMLVSAGVGIGGSERVVLDLTRGLLECGTDVRSVFPGSLDSVTKKWLVQDGLPVETHDAVLRIDEPRNRHTIRKLTDLLKESCAPVVNFHYGGNFIFVKDMLAARLAGKRVVASVHHPYLWNETGQKKRLQTFLCGLLLYKIVVPTILMREIMEQAGIPRRKLSVILYGIGEPRSRPSREAARTRLGLPQDVFVISALARLVPDKGIADLIEALRILDARDSLLLVAGSGPARQDLEAQAKRDLGTRFRFLGRVEEADDFYAASDLFVLPSYMEGFGLVFIEAAMHGVPSIGTKVGGVPEAIEDGLSGLLIPPKSPEVLADRLRRLYKDSVELEQMGEAARLRALSRFTARKMAQGYEQVFFG